MKLVRRPSGSLWGQLGAGRPSRSLLSCVVAGTLLVACATAGRPGPSPRPTAAATADDAFLGDLEARSFRWFWDLADPKTKLVPDRAPSPSFASVAAVGFALTAYPIGAERGWVTREETLERTLATLQFLADAPKGPGPGTTGHRGFFYHFLDMNTGVRYEKVELSTLDTALLLAGALFCESYFDRDDPREAAVRALAEKLYAAPEWTWIQPREPLICMGWTPESGFIPADYHGYDEAMILYLLALGSPTHPVRPEAWEAFTKTYRWGTFHGQEHVAFGPLFGHQYSHVFIDFRGIRDAYMRGKGIDYFENSRRATLAQRAYAVANPLGWDAYGHDVWGLTACDGPTDATLSVRGQKRTFHTYWARGAGLGWDADDGTLAPTAAASSLPFAPEIVTGALNEMRRRWGDHVYGRYGLVDAFNPTFRFDVRVHHGKVVPGVGWFDTDSLGIDQGPIVAMIENYRTGLVWRTMRRNPHVVKGLRRAGFSGGWLDGR